ncbi:MAG: hypothetical protein LCH79_15460 [Proteobacteria bacterium]|nr:hypothetical protein [Pseudomonadota bacterium]
MNAVAEIKPGALAATTGSGRMAVADIISHVAMVQEVMKAVMKPDVHYGVIPGTDKPTLYKQGAEVLCMAFRVSDTYSVEDLSTPDMVRYRVTCTGSHQISGTVLGTGMGEASSGEEKYKWRKAWDDEFDATPENLRRIKMGKYKTKQVRTEPADLANTILKMANKRAKIAMTINVTACGDMFGQDLEDMDAALREHLTRREGDDRQPDQPQAPPIWPDDKFNEQFPRWKKAVEAGMKTAADITALAKSKGELTPAQQAQINALTKPAADEIVMTYAQVADRLNKAADADKLAEAGSLITTVADEAQRKELTALYERRAAEINPA